MVVKCENWEVVLVFYCTKEVLKLNGSWFSENSKLDLQTVTSINDQKFSVQRPTLSLWGSWADIFRGVSGDLDSKLFAIERYSFNSLLFKRSCGEFDRKSISCDVVNYDKIKVNSLVSCTNLDGGGCASKCEDSSEGELFEHGFFESF